MLISINVALGGDELTHWGRVKHTCVSKLTIIGSDNGLSHGQRQAIIWTNARILLIGPLGTKFNEISITIHAFSFKKINLKMSPGKRLPFCLGLNELRNTQWWRCLTFLIVISFCQCQQYGLNKRIGNGDGKNVSISLPSGWPGGSFRNYMALFHNNFFP